MGIIIFSFEDAVIWGQNWQKYPTTYKWRITTWAFFFRHCHEGAGSRLTQWSFRPTDDKSMKWDRSHTALKTCLCFKLIFTCNSNSCFSQNIPGSKDHCLSYICATSTSLWHIPHVTNFPFPPPLAVPSRAGATKKIWASHTWKAINQN